jgi:uncharacterized protein (TIGR00159 family)
MTEMTETLLPHRLIDLADVLVVWVLVTVALISLRHTRARLALTGVGILVGIYLVAQVLGLTLTSSILGGFVAVSVLIVVVVFQEDLRRLFEQIAALGLRRTQGLAAVADAVDTLARALTNLADQKRGALVVIPGGDPLERHLDGGVPLDARISEPLLLSLFDPHSAGHDGAVVLQGDRAAKFAVHLPLSSDHRQLGQRGTRHAAGLGLAERCDALAIIVSEERGTISVAHEGQLRTLRRPSEIAEEVRRFLAEEAHEAAEASRSRRLITRWREALLALPVALVLWMLTVPGGTLIEVTRDVPVTVRDLPENLVLESTDPETVEVRVSGPRRDLLFLEADDLRVAIDVFLAELGRRTFSIDDSNVSAPAGVDVVRVTPETVRISVRPRAQSPAKAPAAPAPPAR